MASYIWIAARTKWSEASMVQQLQPPIGPQGMALAPWREWREEDQFNRDTGKLIPDYKG